MVSAERSLESKRNAKRLKQADVETAEAYLAETTATYERVCGILKEEIERFEKTKAREIGKCIRRVGKIAVAYHLKCADAYKPLIDM